MQKKSGKHNTVNLTTEGLTSKWKTTRTKDTEDTETKNKNIAPHQELEKRKRGKNEKRTK